jgi:chromosome partitioning protein
MRPSPSAAGTSGRGCGLAFAPCTLGPPEASRAPVVNLQRGYLRESALTVYTLSTQPICGVTMILAVGSIKGGVGKTMLAVNIAVALAQQGRDVLLIDGDDQASAATFARIRADLPVKCSFTTIQLHGASIRQQMLHLAGKYNRIIIDVGGRDTGSLRAALTVADVILIPFQPRSVDLWTAAQMTALVVEARYVNERLRAFAVLNLADPQGTDNAEAAEALATIHGVEALPFVVVRRKAFPNAFSSGLSVFEQERKDPKAVYEALSVVDALYTQEVVNDYQNARRKAG